MNDRILRRLSNVASLALAAVIACSGTSCTTTYDAYGRPVQSMDPGLAVAGIAAAGLIGYAVANNNNHNGCYGGHHGGGYRPPCRTYTTYGVSAGSGYRGGYGGYYGGGY
jgi:hypothetical protein